MGIQTKKKDGVITAYVAVIFNGGRNNRTSYDYSLSKYGKYAEVLANKSFKANIKYNNYYEEKENYYILYLYRKKTNTYHKCYIDKDDYDYSSKYYWSIKEDVSRKHNNLYVYRHISTKTTKYMHREIMNIESELVIDHINGNGLDNRKINLNVVTNKENATNRPNLNYNNVSGVSGVSFDTTCNSWRAAWIENGIKRSRSFSTKLYGYDEAKQMAIDIRLTNMHKNNYLSK